MKKIKIFTLAAVIGMLSVGFCTAQTGSYGDLSAVYKDLVKVMKSEKWEDIENYCDHILIDDNTLRYMQQVNYSYRGYPALKDRFPMIVHYGRAMFLNELVKIHSNLQKEGKLQSIEFVALESDMAELLNKELGIEGTEASAIFRAGGVEYRCKVGEMLKINGQWKCFTFEPKMMLK